MFRRALRNAGSTLTGLHSVHGCPKTGPTCPSLAHKTTTSIVAAGAAILHQHLCIHHHAMSTPTLLQHHMTLDVFPPKGGKDDNLEPTAAAAGTTSSTADTFCNPRLVCTIGPSCNTVPKLMELISTGMSVARLNFSHGSRELHLQTINDIREASFRCRTPVAIALDTKGAEIRTGSFLTSDSSGTVGVTLETGAHIDVTVDPAMANKCTKDLLFLDYPEVIQSAKVGSRILIADGTVELTCVDNVGAKQPSTSTQFRCKVTSGGYLSGRNNVHLPGIDVHLPSISTRDDDDIRFGVDHGIDMIFASFVRSQLHVEEMRSLVQRQLDRNHEADERRKVIEETASSRTSKSKSSKETTSALVSSSTRERDVIVGPAKRRQATDIPIIAKIENHRGVYNIDEILEAADGVMVARGDLGVEIPVERVFLAQKMMIAKCNGSAKPAICATQMLESMKASPRPTRAEASDVANAVIDGSDAVMLSGETASGQYPLEALQTLKRIARQGHRYISSGRRLQEILSSSSAAASVQAAAAKDQSGTITIHDSVASSAVLLAYEIKANLIVTTTVSGRSVRLLSKYNPSCPIIAVCHTLSTYMKLTITSGVVPVYLPALASRLEKMQVAKTKTDAADGDDGVNNLLQKLQALPLTGELSRLEWVNRFDEWIEYAIDGVKCGAFRDVEGVMPSSVAEGSRVVVTCTDDQVPKGIRGLSVVRQI